MKLMATAPVKSQPLHNFPLSHLKWGNKAHQTSSSSNRFRHRDSPPPELPHHHRGVKSEEEDVLSTTKLLTGPRTARNQLPRSSFSPCSSKPKQEQDVVASGGDQPGDGEPSWNLRPRKPVNFGTETMSFGEPEKFERAEDNKRSSRSCAAVKAKPKAKPEPGPSKLWISLSREEIEEDVYALTGSRPSRRPKKRPKTVQKQVDNVLPGMYMVGATVDSFRLHDALV